MHHDQWDNENNHLFEQGKNEGAESANINSMKEGLDDKHANRSEMDDKKTMEDSSSMAEQSGRKHGQQALLSKINEGFEEFDR